MQILKRASVGLFVSDKIGFKAKTYGEKFSSPGRLIS